jgi:hypothetical protein
MENSWSFDPRQVVWNVKNLGPLLSLEPRYVRVSSVGVDEQRALIRRSTRFLHLHGSSPRSLS